MVSLKTRLTSFGHKKYKQVGLVSEKIDASFNVHIAFYGMDLILGSFIFFCLISKSYKQYCHKTWCAWCGLIFRPFGFIVVQ